MSAATADTDLPDWLPEDQAVFMQVARHVPLQIQRGVLPDPAHEADEAPQPHLRPLWQFLLDERAVADAPHAQLATWLAAACMGGHHLWQDLGLSGRPQVSRLMALAFPRLFEANTRNFRWKRHLFLCLGESLGLDELRPPRCGECEDFDVCVGAPAADQPPAAPAAIRITPSRPR